MFFHPPHHHPTARKKTGSTPKEVRSRSILEAKTEAAYRLRLPTASPCLKQWPTVSRIRSYPHFRATEFRIHLDHPFYFWKDGYLGIWFLSIFAHRT